MLDACRVEHVIVTMQHGYVQCSQLGCTGLCNYCHRELQLLLGASDNEDSQSSTSERGPEDSWSDGVSDQGNDLVEEEMAGKELYQDSSDGT